MKKSTYGFGIFFAGLAVACGLLQNIVSFQIGGLMFTLSSFINWFMVATIINLAATLFLLKYYHHRKYWFTFIAATFTTMVNLFLALVVYRILASREWESLYLPVQLVSLGATIVYGISLLFSPADKNVWLKRAGLAILIIGLVLGGPFIWSMVGRPRPLNNIVKQITLWAQIAGALASVFYIMQFLTEIVKLEKEKKDTPEKDWVITLFGVAGLGAFIGAVALGVMLSSECISQVYSNKQNTNSWVQPFEARQFVNKNGSKLLYRLLKPLNYDAKKQYPLVVSLPYGGQPAEDTLRQVEGAVAAEALSTEANRSAYPAFIFVPNCPPGSGWGGIAGYPSVDTLVYQAIASLDKDFSIDDKRRYVTGLSRGGYGTWNFICTHPEMFAAAIPVSGAGDPKLAPKIADIPVWAFHGAKDMNVLVSGSRNMITAIKKAGGKPVYTEYANEGHNIWNNVAETPGLWDWLFAQKRR